MLKDFLAKVRTPDDLVTYAGGAGYRIEQASAESLFAIGQTTYDRYSGSLNDDELDAVNGGISWAMVGLGLGATLGIAAVTILTMGAAPAIGLALTYGATTMSSVVGGVVATGGAFAFSGAVTLGAVGKVADTVIDAVHA